MLVRIHPENPQQRLIKQMVECLKDGGIIVYPTDTIYGLGCDIFNQKLWNAFVASKVLNHKKHSCPLYVRPQRLKPVCQTVRYTGVSYA
jgi:tRNA A37 threonylcarbamoyladenosine synthetase subunit TsaC/SUA5/YrdC